MRSNQTSSKGQSLPVSLRSSNKPKLAVNVNHVFKPGSLGDGPKPNRTKKEFSISKVEPKLMVDKISPER